jgi:hypothetical protein
VAGQPLCLVLSFKLAVLNGVAFRVGYNVTMSSPFPGHIDKLDLQRSDAPALITKLESASGALPAAFYFAA